MTKHNSQLPGTLLPWAGKLVRPEHVENELSSLWRLASDNMRISNNIHVRTSVLNFVICALDPESARNASLLLRDLSSTHIARVILLILDPRSDLDADISTWVTLRSFPIISDVMRHHFEQITVQLSGAAVHSAHHILLSLLKPDLPVYIWWLNDLPEDLSIFSRLINTSSRVIIDSRSFSHPNHVSLLSSLLGPSPNYAISDLNWSRITPWRELIAQFFDVADYRPFLLGINRVEIEHSVSPSSPDTTSNEAQFSPNPIRALLLAAWLKTRLGWQPALDDLYHLNDPLTGTYAWQMSHNTSSLLLGTHTGRTGKLNLPANDSVFLSINPRPRLKLPPGEICLVRLSCSFEGQQAFFTISRDDDADHVITSVEIAQETRPWGTASINATRKESDLLSDELDIMGRDHLYEQTLQEVFALLA